MFPGHFGGGWGHELEAKFRLKLVRLLSHIEVRPVFPHT